MSRRLYRCRHDRKLAGVAAGLAEYFDLDPTLVRVLFFASIFFGGFGILVYLALAIVVPLEPLSEAEAAALSVGGVAPEAHRHVERGGDGRLVTFFGFGLILLGTLALVDALLPGWEQSWRYLWPAFLVGIGALLVAGALRRDGRGGTSGASGNDASGTSGEGWIGEARPDGPNGQPPTVTGAAPLTE